MPLVLALSGSPRREGNSETLLNEALSGAKAAGGQIEKFVLNELNITPCQECAGCDKTGICTVDDDMSLIYDKLDAAQVIIMASPIFFSGISAQLKAVVDRCQAHWIRKFILKQSPHKTKRAGAFICVRGQSGLEIFKAASKPVKAAFATEDINYTQELLLDQTDSKGAVAKHPDFLHKAYELGKYLVNTQQQ